MSASPLPGLSEVQLQDELATHGLRLRGGFVPQTSDPIPRLPGGLAAAGVWLVGVVGSAFWPHFKASPPFKDGQPHPLDRWSRALGEALAVRWGGVALFPFDGPPYWPFQRWANRAEATESSRMMLRIHPEYGLWHAYRFALALPLAPTAPAAAGDAPTDLCARCSGQPCLQACPVGAYTGESFVLDACATHLHSGQGAPCLQGGCLARLACPVGAEHRYLSEHAAFHMRAFADSHG